MRRPFFLSLVLAALLAPAAIRAGEETDDLSAEIREAELVEHVRTLASDEFEGRRSGTPGGDRAAAYIAGRFRAAGLVPLGDDGTFLQRFDLPGGEPVAEESSLAIKAPGAEPVVFPLDPLWSAFPGSTAGKLADLPVVFAGYGIHAPKLGYDDYAGIDVKGKVALVLRHSPRKGKPEDLFGGQNRIHAFFATKLRAAQNAGAAALVLVNDRGRRQGDDPDPTVGGGAGRGRIPFVFFRKKVAEALFRAAGADLSEIEQKIEETGKPASALLPDVRLDLTLVMKTKPTANVVGMVRGSDERLAEEVVVIGAHYDHLGTDGRGGIGRAGEDRIWNGADDNASGTSGVIELAEHFALARARPRRSLVFVAFAAEELGLIGSGHYVAHPAVPLERTVAMVNLDMIGRSDGKRLFVGGVGTSPAFDGILTEAAEGSGLEIQRGQGGAAPSDNYTFFRRMIPSLFFFTGLHGDYHRPSDHWDTLNYEAEKRVVDVAAGVVRRVADLDSRPAFENVTAGGFPGRRRGPYLGVSPDPRPGGPGARIMQVVKGTPAEKAGLLAGDRIVKFGDVEIGDWNALRAALQKRKKGEEVDVEVLRGEERKTLRVKLG